MYTLFSLDVSYVNLTGPMHLKMEGRMKNFNDPLHMYEETFMNFTATPSKYQLNI